MAVLFSRPQSLTDTPFRYCPGCHHGLAHRLVAEALDELNLREKAVGIASVGCSVYTNEFFNCDTQQAAHGRAPAVATAVKRARPECFVFTYQGDGDLASIGMAETIHAAARGENISIIFINNACYGMTGGQMAPTTLPGQKTTTSPLGREAAREGNPIDMMKLLNALEGPAYLSRVLLTSPGKQAAAKRSILRAFRAQMKGLGFSLVEILSACPSNWRMTPVEALRYVDEVMAKYYPPGEVRVAKEVLEG